jgi:hypothetical protein
VGDRYSRREIVLGIIVKGLTWNLNVRLLIYD